ncbi:YbaB/EbfC family nucleoid-associated protein [Mycolicibacterium sp. GF69]|uniref:YbaB/EbfC family nucleoid-associated protein n=1 Tax=Mycolicibacterium sp. GF69 TaxID=2267251 RepID=UPI00140340D0|nr:YbaB/EbfC family nucleoid-associated protein [Mycolicibacterium sp. GF69]
MTDEMHPDVAAVLQQAQRLQSIMDDQLHRMNTQTFTATDESETVEVTLNGHHQLIDVFIEEGLLRLGVETVQQRLDEALQNAATAATASIEADRERIDAAVAEITDISHDQTP